VEGTPDRDAEPVRRFERFTPVRMLFNKLDIWIERRIGRISSQMLAPLWLEAAAETQAEWRVWVGAASETNTFH
jgi:hypothetical protein